MASPAQIAANRANAQRSTGPRTREGKAASSQNALAHGLTTCDLVVHSGEHDEFTQFTQELWDEVRPLGAIEAVLCRGLIHAAWNVRRCHCAEVKMATLEPDIDPLVYADHDNRLRNIDLYARRAESGLYRAIKELRKLQTEKQFPAEVSCAVECSPLVDTAQLYRDLAAVGKQDSSTATAAANHETTIQVVAPPPPAPVDTAFEKTKPISMVVAATNGSPAAANDRSAPQLRPNRPG